MHAGKKSTGGKVTEDASSSNGDEEKVKCENCNEDKVKLILSQHQEAMERVAKQHHEQLLALRKDRKAHHSTVVSKHSETMDAIKEQHAKAIEELTAKEAEKKAVEQGAQGQAVLFPGPVKGSFKEDGKTLAPALFKAENLQVAAQSDFYRCKFMDHVVSGVMVRGKDPVTQKVGQYLKCTPPAQVENGVSMPQSIAVVGSVDGGESWFGTGITYTYPMQDDAPEDDPSSFESILKLRKSAEAWKRACDHAVSKLKKFESKILNETAFIEIAMAPEEQAKKQLLSSNARVACQRFNDATNDANEASIAMHARIKAEKSANIAQNYSELSKNQTAQAKEMRRDAYIERGRFNKMKNTALTLMKVAQTRIANATAEARKAEHTAKASVAERQDALKTLKETTSKINATTARVSSLESIVTSLTLQLKQDKSNLKSEEAQASAEENVLKSAIAGNSRDDKAVAGVKEQVAQAEKKVKVSTTVVAITEKRLNHSATELSKLQAEMESLVQIKNEANATARDALKNLFDARETAQKARTDGVNATKLLHTSQRNLTAASDGVRKAEQSIMNANKLIEKAERSAKIAEAAIQDVRYEGNISNAAARHEKKTSTSVGMRVHPDILRTTGDILGSKAIPNLMNEEPGVVVPGGRRVGPALDHSDAGFGEMPDKEDDEEEDAETGGETGISGISGASGATGLTGMSGASGATGTLGASTSTGMDSAASGMGADFAAALAIEKRTLSMKNKEMLNERAMRKKNKKVPVADDEMLGIPKRHVTRPISEKMIAASLKKGCDYKNEGMLWCESLGRCYEPRTEDGSCMDKRDQLPTTITPLTASMMTGGATGATGGEDVPAIDVESADMIDAVKQVKKKVKKPNN